MYDNGYVRLTALPTGILLFPQRFASALPPFEGGGGGMFLCVRSFVIQSEAMNLLLFPARFLTVFGMTRGGVRNDKGGSKSIFIQAYSPPPRCDTFFPNASHWAELSRPFRAVFQWLIVNGYLPGT